MPNIRARKIIAIALSLLISGGPALAQLSEISSSHNNSQNGNATAHGLYNSQILTGDFNNDGKTDTAEITTALIEINSPEAAQNAFVGVAKEFEQVLNQNPSAKTEIVNVVSDDSEGRKEATEFKETLPENLQPYLKTVPVERTRIERLKAWAKEKFNVISEHNVAYRSVFAMTRLTINTTVTYLGLQKAFPYIPDEVAFKSALFAGVFSGTIQLFAPAYSALLKWNREKLGSDLWVWIGLEILFLLPSTGYLHMHGFKMEPMFADMLGVTGGLFTAFMWRVLVSTFGQYPWDSAISGDKDNRIKERPDDRHYRNLQTFYESLKFVSISALSVGLWSLTLSDSAVLGWISNGGLVTLGIAGFMFQEAVYKGPKSKVRKVFNKVKNACRALLGSKTLPATESIEVDGKTYDLNPPNDKAS